MIRSFSRRLHVKTTDPSPRRDRREDDGPAAAAHKTEAAGQTHWLALQSTTNLVKPAPLSLEPQEKPAWDPSQPVPLSPIPIGPPPSSYNQPVQPSQPRRTTSLARKASRSIQRSLSRKPKPSAHVSTAHSVPVGKYHGAGGHLAGAMGGGAVVSEMELDLGDVVDTIDLSKLGSSAQPVATETDGFAGFTRVRGMGGYTWLKPSAEGGTSTILVPGQPDVWDPPDEGTHIRPSCTPPRRPDMIDYNALQHPASSTEPMFHALADDGRADAPLPQLVTDRADLLKLFAYVRDPSESHDFRIDLECVGGATVVMSRWEPASGMRASPARAKAAAVMGLSYAPAWLEAVTRRSGDANGAEIDREAGTFAMVQYRFGSTDLLVRFEVDAALPSKRAPTESGSRAAAATSSSAGTLRVRHGNRPLPDHSSLVALKLVSARAVPDWQAMYLSLAFAQLPRVLMGRNDKGDISSHAVEDVALGEHPQMIAAAEDTASTMATLETLLRRIADGARRAYAQQQSPRRGDAASGGRMALIVRDGQMSLVRIKSTKQGSPSSGLSLAAKERILRGQDSAPPLPSAPVGSVSRSRTITQAIKNRF